MMLRVLSIIGHMCLGALLSAASMYCVVRAIQYPYTVKTLGWIGLMAGSCLPACYLINLSQKRKP